MKKDSHYKNYVYLVLCMTGDVMQITIDSYTPNQPVYKWETNDLEKVFLLDPIRFFARTSLTNFAPIGDAVNFVLPACIQDTALELAENNLAVKRIRRPFKNYNNLIFLDVDFPRGSKLVVRIESIYESNQNGAGAFGFGLSPEPPTLIESMKQIKDFQRKFSCSDEFSLDIENTRTVEDMTFRREPDGSVTVTPTDGKSTTMISGTLKERNDVYPYFDLVGVADRIRLIEYQRGDGKNVRDLGLDLVPGI